MIALKRILLRHYSATERALVKPVIPDHLDNVPLLEVFRRPLFPGYYKTISIANRATAKHVQERFKMGKSYIGVFLSKRSSLYESSDPFHLENVFDVGALSQILTLSPSPNAEGLNAVVLPHKRIVVGSVADGFGTISALPEIDCDAFQPAIIALCQEIFYLLGETARMSPFFREHIAHNNVSPALLEDPRRLADLVAVLCSGEPGDLQIIMDSISLEDRLKQALTLLKKENVAAKLQQDISRDVEQKLAQRQREYVLLEQLKTIKKELGLDSDVKEKAIATFSERMAATHPPDAIKKAFDDEVKRFSTIETGSPEFANSRNYLEWISFIPWGQVTEDSFDLAQAEATLNADHYGLKDVKARILEFIAVASLRKSIDGKVLCLVGPPGVGKTSIASSIARSLNRAYYRFSVGGLTDVSEIKGHRRTYIGSLPGKIIHALKTSKSMNPVIVIDEIDKLGRSHHGDPASALLEVFDSQQNTAFVDHYLDIPVDLSKILFVCTANSLDTIPQPLLDRMEIFELSGYLQEEKVEIANRHLIPQIITNCGLQDKNLKFSSNSLAAIAQSYNRESGVRGLQKSLEKILRKVAFKFVKTGDLVALVDEATVREHLGPPIFDDERLHNAKLPSGVAIGLAWTPMGGSSIFVESSISKGSGIVITGQLGKVMEESVKIAVSYVKRHFKKSKNVLDGSLHVHVPEGATPKDGPSAGITIATSLYSLAEKLSVPSEIAMTGELTLTGKVLKVGGIREKLIAAKRAGISKVLLPKDNKNDYEALDESVKAGIDVQYVASFTDVLQVCFPSVKQ